MLGQIVPWQSPILVSLTPPVSMGRLQKQKRQHQIFVRPKFVVFDKALALKVLSSDRINLPVGLTSRAPYFSRFTLRAPIAIICRMIDCKACLDSDLLRQIRLIDDANVL